MSGGMIAFVTILCIVVFVAVILFAGFKMRADRRGLGEFREGLSPGAQNPLGNDRL
jgi:uncharacterized membrane protein